jgi:hypothetical protein
MKKLETGGSAFKLCLRNGRKVGRKSVGTMPAPGVLRSKVATPGTGDLRDSTPRLSATQLSSFSRAVGPSGLDGVSPYLESNHTPISTRCVFFLVHPAHGCPY